MTPRRRFYGRFLRGESRSNGEARALRAVERMRGERDCWLEGDDGGGEGAGREGWMLRVAGGYVCA